MISYDWFEIQNLNIEESRAHIEKVFALWINMQITLISSWEINRQQWKNLNRINAKNNHRKLAKWK